MRFGVLVGLLGGVVSLGAPPAYGQAQVAPAPAAQAPTTQAPVGPSTPSATVPTPAAQFPTDVPTAPGVAPPAVATASTAALAAPVGPVPASAPTPEAEPRAAKEQPSWNVGAGLLLPLGWGAPQDLATAPAYAAIIERRVGASTWLTFNVTASYNSQDVPLRPLASDDVLERQTLGVYSGTMSLLLGVRRAFVQKLVEVSVDGAVLAGRQSIWRDDLRAGESFSSFETVPSQAYAIGVQAGLTLERQLIEALALRLTIDAASLTFTTTHAATIDALGVATPLTRQNFRAALLLQSGLQLHFYF